MKFEPSRAAFKCAKQSIDVLAHNHGSIWLLLSRVGWRINVLSFPP